MEPRPLRIASASKCFFDAKNHQVLNDCVTIKVRSDRECDKNEFITNIFAILRAISSNQSTQNYFQIQDEEVDKSTVHQFKSTVSIMVEYYVTVYSKKIIYLAFPKNCLSKVLSNSCVDHGLCHNGT